MVSDGSTSNYQYQRDHLVGRLTNQMVSQQKPKIAFCDKTFKLPISTQIQVNKQGILSLAAWHRNQSILNPRYTNQHKFSFILTQF